MQHFFEAFFTSILATLFTTLGIYVIRHFEDWGRQQVTYFACFAAGVLISASFLYIVPKSFSMSLLAPIFLLSGYLMMHFFNRFITVYVCSKPTDQSYTIGLVPLLGIGFHSFIDGVIYSVTFTVSTFTGVLAAIGMVLHEFPEGIVVYLLLIRSGFKEKTSLFLAFLAAALTTPLGMLISFPFIHQISQQRLGCLLALSAGALIYVGATHLLPHAEKEPRHYSLVAFILGIAVAVIIVLSK
ncbi:MAG: ZIP family metal transporter [Gammaproteobacteria bacterium]|nr:ZIP family metal transporter [Gammaproteobacteria bacterium]